MFDLKDHPISQIEALRKMHYYSFYLGHATRAYVLLLFTILFLILNSVFGWIVLSEYTHLAPQWFFLFFGFFAGASAIAMSHCRSKVKTYSFLEGTDKRNIELIKACVNNPDCEEYRQKVARSGRPLLNGEADALLRTAALRRGTFQQHELADALRRLTSTEPLQ